MVKAYVRDSEMSRSLARLSIVNQTSAVRLGLSIIAIINGSYVEFWRKQARTPCSDTTTQIMFIDSSHTSNGEVAYAKKRSYYHHREYHCYDVQVGVSQSEIWGISQSQYQAQKSVIDIIAKFLLTYPL